VYFYSVSGLFPLLIQFVMMTLTIFVTIKFTESQTELRRDYYTKCRDEYAIKNDIISNYETVKVSLVENGGDVVIYGRE
jgi:ABC-type transport system involved in Fe-S cluster assembly fused permease/ATPase subunit